MFQTVKISNIKCQKEEEPCLIKKAVCFRMCHSVLRSEFYDFFSVPCVLSAEVKESDIRPLAKLRFHP